MEVRVQDLKPFCTVQVEGYGAVDVENTYLPSVIACENGNAPMEALKMQAVAARTYAQFITEAERRPLQPTTRDQVYNCSRQPEQKHIDAVRATAGQVLTHEGRLSVGFYVAGAIPSAANGCRATSSSSDPTGTERYVTYNSGRTGNDVRATPLGNLNHPNNRGAKSQNGATCLANDGWTVDRIARFYYGDDIRLQELPGGTCGGSSEPGGGGDDVCRLGVAQNAGPSQCASSDEMPNILPRSAWNARPPRRNQSVHSPNRITIHHTVTSNTTTNHAAQVRQVQGWHFDNGWPDIGYHFLIARDGTIYRGAAENRLGVHVRNQNSHNLGIALLGSYHLGVAPTEEQLKSTARMVRYLSDKYNIAINRDKIKGHGERMSTLCPGQQVLSRMDQILDMARADSVCGVPDLPEDEGTPEDETGLYHYVRVTGLSATPEPTNPALEGYEVDAIYFERHGDDPIYATSVACSPGVNNPGGALGKPDNESCEDRRQTVAGVPVGADLVVQLPKPMKSGDILHVTQSSYQASLSPCSPGGTARISVSEDGRVWKVLSHGATENWRITLDEAHFEPDDSDMPNSESQGFDFISPRAGNWYTPNVAFRVRATNPEVVKVTYHAEEFALGDSSNRDDYFAFEREFNRFGQRTLIARGFNAAGEKIAEKRITITVADFDGTVPDGLDDPGGAFGDADVNGTLAERMAAEGGKCQDGSDRRCTNGTGGYSTGHCWRFVKRALERAGVNYNALAGAGPCSAYQFALAAYGFRCNADANPSVLRSIGLQRIDVPTTQAPRGAIISWNRGCLGYHALYGHIEISMGNGTACSDYCGRIRGDATCASVYVPVN